MSLLDAEDRLGFRMQTIGKVSIKRILTEANYTLEGEESILKTKEKVYDEIVQYLTVEGYPTEADVYFKGSNVSDLVHATISPILCDGTEEFAAIEGERDSLYRLFEAKRSSLGEAMKQCLLAMKDMRDNGGGEVYGFVTTGEHWRMIRYEGASFISTKNFTVLLDTMETDKEGLMKENSVVVDCMNVALRNGGTVKK
ncbi:hypothetical protein BDD12DRAFT_874577 [Trichophaea hybrida]|nr:hypothetical protein BDD12DRAFT_874577 [Trichophaea hybrida]